MPQNYDFLTAEEILSPSRDEAISSANPQLTALQNTQMVEFIHWLNGEFVNAAHGTHQNIIIPSSFTGWSWMRRTSNFSIYTHNSLSALIVAGAPSFTLTSATNWDNEGRSVIETARGALDFVDHTNKSSNTLTVSSVDGAETVSIGHAAGNRVHKLYPVASDFSRIIQMWVNQLPYEEERFIGMFPRARRFSVYGQYLFLPRGTAAADGTLVYEKAPTNITSLSTRTNIPRRFKRWAIYMTLHHLYTIRRKRGDIVPALEMAERELQTAINADSVSSTSTRIRLA